jgi:hypothetical protein
MKTKTITLTIPAITLPAMPTFKKPTWKRSPSTVQDHINEDCRERIACLETEVTAIRDALQATLRMMKKTKK